ncbi:MAG: hypothetical protein JWO53_504, partial [Chlamydiia bacterium]|nr:hypothetical protein [Chlamydiia bacterium]
HLIFSESIEPLFKLQDFRDKFIDWVKAAMPADFEKARFDAIKQAIAKLEVQEAKKYLAYKLEGLDDYSLEIAKTMEERVLATLEKKTSEEIIEEARAQAYLGTVISNGIDRKAIIDSLIKLQIIEPAAQFAE